MRYKILTFQLMLVDGYKVAILGKNTSHSTTPANLQLNDNRMTILTHFFDPLPKYGLGAIMGFYERVSETFSTP